MSKGERALAAHPGPCVGGAVLPEVSGWEVYCPTPHKNFHEYFSESTFHDSQRLSTAQTNVQLLFRTPVSLPQALRREAVVRFDTARHNLYEAAVELLQRAGKAVGEFAAEEEGQGKEEEGQEVQQAEREGEHEEGQGGGASQGEGAGEGAGAGASADGESAGAGADGERAGSISGSLHPLNSLKLERFRCRKGIFRDFKARQRLYQAVGRDEAFLEKYVA